ncbi:unnamed protein product [Rhodiola kirilowii]
MLENICYQYDQKYMVLWFLLNQLLLPAVLVLSNQHILLSAALRKDIKCHDIVETCEMTSSATCTTSLNMIFCQDTLL